MNCLLCWDNCSPQKEGEETQFSLLGRELKTVFVLRELLRLPPEKLTEFLERSGGDHPHQWINFCDPCQELVNKAFSLFEQKVMINRKLKKVQEQVILKVKQSQGGGEGDGVAEETRDFVKNHEFGPFENPFLVGDHEAEWRVEMRKALQPPEDEIVVKEEVEQEIQDLHDPRETFTDPETSSSDDEEEEPRGKRGGTVKQGRFLCPLCPAGYASKSGRWKHVNRKHKGQSHMLKYGDNVKPITCPKCHKVFKGRKGLDLHRQLLGADCTTKAPPADDAGGSCPVCQKYFPTTPKLKHHQAYSRCRTGVPCRQKNQVLDAELAVEESTGETLYRCSVPHCGNTYKLRQSFLQHKRAHQDAKKLFRKPGIPKTGSVYPCPECPRTFSNRLQRFRHVKRQHRPNSVPENLQVICPLCQQRCLGERGFAVHKHREHPEHRAAKQRPKRRSPGQKVSRPRLQYPLHCEHCGKTASNSDRFKSHQAEKHFICGVAGCGEQLEGKEQLHAHQVGVHGREVNLLRCQDCGKLWPNRGKLVRHQRQAHRKSAEDGGTLETHICEQCGKTFALKEYLHNHVWHAHKKMRKYKPKSCDRTSENDAQ